MTGGGVAPAAGMAAASIGGVASGEGKSEAMALRRALRTVDIANG